MITPMDQLLLVGRKRSVQDVLVSLQSLGVVQVDRLDPGDEGLRRFQPSEVDLERKANWDRAVGRSTFLLEALGVGDEVPVSGKGDLPVDAASVAERIDAVGDQVDALLAERAAVADELAVIEAHLPVFRDLAPTLAQLESSRYLYGAATLVGSEAVEAVSADLRASLDGHVAFETRPRGKQTLLVVAVPRAEATALRAALAKHGLAEIQLPERYRALGTAKAVHTMEERYQALPKRRAAIAEELDKLALQHGPRLKALRLTARNHQARLERMLDLVEGSYAFALKGWVPSADRPRVVEALRKQFGDDVQVRHRPADEHHDHDAPVQLQNAPWVRPFQGLLSLFAPPAYGSFDPTWTLAVFFPLFFGIVVGDIGFGLMFAGIAWFMRRRGQAGRSLSLGPLGIVIKPQALKPISTVIFWAAGWSIVWGYVYGEFFGNFLEYWPKGRPIFYTTLHHDPGYGLIEILLFRVEVFTPLLLLSIGFGVLQVLGGWVIRAVYGFRHNDMKHVYEGVGMFAGIAAIVIFAAAFLTDGLNPVVNGVVAIGFVVFLICAVLAKMPLMLVELISNSGNILSYLRLFAVGLSAALVAALATNLGFAVSGTLPIIGPILGIAVALLVHLVALALTMIGHTLQPLRLQYVEFFTKFGFYEASGRPFEPFKLLGGKS
ncbi:MAG: V-type ATPase 116kDa subunit family protein [Trueperaceae bacterium]|nr:V-type ATPase 116kDa subunit family protein [Trueperaceae bacterium]